MASLHKFKILASQCAVISGNPTQSPTTSPVIHLRRRKTLRMLLSRSTASDHHRRRLSRRDDPSDLREDPPDKKNVRRKLKDLFVSSPPPSSLENKDKDHNSQGGAATDDADADDDLDLLPVSGSDGRGGSRFGGGSINRGLASRRVGGGGLRPLSGTFRYRLLRRAWRPVLVTIPE